MPALNISLVIPTRGDHDLTPILENIPFDDIVVWDNSKRTDHGVYARYAAIRHAKHDLIATQDDDCIVPWDALLAEYNPGERLCNMPDWKQAEYPHSSLLGWGALFSVSDAWEAFRGRFGSVSTDEFFRTCDVIFTVLKPFRRVDLGHEDMPYATNPERMYRQPGHDFERARVTANALAAAT